LRRRRLLLVVLAFGFAAVVIGAADAATPQVRANRMLLSLGDVGTGYTVRFSGRRTLSDVSAGDSASVRKELARSWVSGAEQAFRGKVVDRGVISQADVFRKGARMNLILHAWLEDFVRVSDGQLQQLPQAAPGTGGVLVRGRLLRYELLIYIWRHGRAISSVDVTGLNGTVPVALVMKLARVQDAHMASQAA